MSWEKSIEELRRRERLAEEMGGEEPVARQRSRGKLTVRERVAFLADPGSFHEIGKIAGVASYDAADELESFRPSNSVMGRATLDGRPAVILADDFTVRGGAADASIWQKMVQAIKMAAEYHMPLVQMIDGTGGGGSVKMLEKDPRTYIPETPGWNEIAYGLTRVPFVSLALGPCAGMGAGGFGDIFGDVFADIFGGGRAGRTLPSSTCVRAPPRRKVPARERVQRSQPPNRQNAKGGKIPSRARDARRAVPLQHEKSRRVSPAALHLRQFR
jgi:hypothetical protein